MNFLIVLLDRIRGIWRTPPHVAAMFRDESDFIVSNPPFGERQ